jgi:hypothetical protein
VSPNTSINDGGPAFPRPGISTNWAEGYHTHKGMSLRDWFAAQEQLNDCGEVSIDFLETLVNSPTPKTPLEYIIWEAKTRAKLKFIRADAMLAARKEM